MPIKRYDDQLKQTGGSLPRIGKLKKGRRKDNGAPEDLTYFRFVADGPDDVKSRLESLFAERYGNEPRKLRILLPYPSPDENFDYWMEHWGKSGLKHRCDGERCILLRTETGTMQSFYNVPYDRRPMCPDHDKPTDKKNCKEIGWLKVILPELGRLGYVWAKTGSKWDIKFILEQLHGLYEIAESMRGRPDLSGIPLFLYRSPQTISVPIGDNGQRIQKVSWLLTVEMAPDWFQDAARVLEANARPRITDEKERRRLGNQAAQDLYGGWAENAAPMTRQAPHSVIKKVEGEIVDESELSDLEPPDEDTSAQAEPEQMDQFQLMEIVQRAGDVYRKSGRDVTAEQIDEALDTRARERFGVSFIDLTRTQANEMLDDLRKKATETEV